MKAFVTNVMPYITFLKMRVNVQSAEAVIKLFLVVKNLKSKKLAFKNEKSGFSHSSFFAIIYLVIKMTLNELKLECEKCTRCETHEIKDLQGNVLWKFDDEAAKQQFQQHDPYVLEHVDWVNHIRKGTAHVEAGDTAFSCMAAIMGRESAYTGGMTNWDEMTQSPLDYTPAKFELGAMDMSAYTVQVPGTGENK